MIDLGRLPFNAINQFPFEIGPDQGHRGAIHAVRLQESVQEHRNQDDQEVDLVLSVEVGTYHLSV